MYNISNWVNPFRCFPGSVGGGGMNGQKDSVPEKKCKRLRRLRRQPYTTAGYPTPSFSPVYNTSIWR